MKKQSTLTSLFLFVAILTCSALFFQSCTKVDDVAPVTPSYLVTVKVTDMNNESAVSQNQSSKHLRVIDNATQNVILDKDINGSYVFNFNSKTANVSIKATLTSNSDFISSLEIDANGKMHAYHNGSCAGTQFEITDNINF